MPGYKCLFILGVQKFELLNVVLQLPITPEVRLLRFSVALFSLF